MISVEKCPICKCENSQVLRKCQFIFPKTEEYDDLIGDVTYKYERLWIFFEKIRKDRKPAEFDVTLCKTCGMIFTNPRFIAEEVRTKYKTISELESAKKRTQKRHALKADERSRRIYSLITGLQENSPKPQKILDYGGAQGYNLLSFVEAGNFCYLLDYAKYDHSKGVKYLGRDVSNLQADEFFDVILLCHTLEHSTEPKRMINELLSHLMETGLFYVEVPLGCWREWKRLEEPLTHVNFFSEESLFKCLRSAGLDIMHVSTVYQWVTHEKKWCINIVGKKRKGSTITKFKTTRQQIENPYYYLKPLMEKLRHCFWSIFSSRRGKS